MVSLAIALDSGSAPSVALQARDGLAEYLIEPAPVNSNPSTLTEFSMASNGKADSHESKSHHGHSGQRLRKLLHPSGKRVHIAATPEEHVRLKKTLPQIEPDDNFDIHLHGSPEHLNAVQLIHKFHEQRRQTLRDEHTTIYEEFEHVKAELDTLSEELHMLTDHGVELDENFSKYGFDAKIRTREGPDSSASSISDKHHDWNAERHHGKALRFWRRPVVRQYFHKGLLWRSSTLEEVGSFELFVDLLYVGIIAVIGDTAGESLYHFHHPYRCIFTYLHLCNHCTSFTCCSCSGS